MDCGPLTDQEREEMEAIMYEEDICEIADKIKQGIYEAETEGEFEFAGEQGDNLLPIELGAEEEHVMVAEEEMFQKVIWFSICKRTIVGIYFVIFQNLIWIFCI